MPKEDTRVLLVEDSHGLRQTLADILRATGTWVDTAADASDAFRLLARRRYDAAIVDLVLLPGPSGIDVIRHIKSSSPTTRVFACTAYTRGELLDDVRALGVDEVLFKPVDPGLLAKLIEQSAGPVPGEDSQTPHP
jgi:DNA-binding response OmpR family regulator